ncbi:DUF1993 domain-containing protein [Pseudolabrys taiwanensis]|uniref:DUF1993 domain-containing protein n=1 Tax=Pseudolabrys taiwanensis TaxID=331696 RepID=A0A346A2C2_9HYPH|nr:DUF1993 domain-containing protein [Pseudolabrys taiwanensis]AXK83319.1 DUF1993 domain-containing protein [Pseudolabrys taiwanensis]
MSLSMYQASIPPLVRGLTILSAVLKKGEAHAPTLVDARLAPDMLTLVGQVQRASDTSKGCGARLAGVDAPSMDDTEKTFDDLYARIAKTVDFLQSLKREQIDGTEAKRITIKTRDNTIELAGQAYLLNFALPNFYFHVTTAYDILRHSGVPLTKLDYLGDWKSA